MSGIHAADLSGLCSALAASGYVLQTDTLAGAGFYRVTAAESDAVVPMPPGLLDPTDLILLSVLIARPGSSDFDPSAPGLEPLSPEVCAALATVE